MLLGFGQSIKEYLNNYPKLPCNKCLVQIMCLKEVPSGIIVSKRFCPELAEHTRIEQDKKAMNTAIKAASESYKQFWSKYNSTSSNKE